MKKHTKLLATLLVMSVMCTSCSDIFGKNKISSKTVLKAYQELDYEEVDIDDITDSFEGFRDDDIDKTVEDGAYALATDKKEIKNVFDDFNNINYIGVLCDYDKNMEEVYWFVRLENNSSDGMLLSTAVIKFDSAESATDYLDEMNDKKDDDDDDDSDSDAEWEFDAGEDGKLKYVLGSLSGDANAYTRVDAYIGIYQQGPYVFIIAGADVESDECADAIEEICEALDLESPTDL